MRDRDPSQEDPKKSSDRSPKLKKVRTAHGTRVFRRVTCERCGAHDQIHFAPKKAGQAFCRRCAEEVLGVVDPDGSRLEHTFTCTGCGRIKRGRGKNPPPSLLCADCIGGIATAQGTRAKSGRRVSERIVVVPKVDPPPTGAE